jgi:hypothetical protein
MIEDLGKKLRREGNKEEQNITIATIEILAYV